MQILADIWKPSQTDSSRSGLIANERHLAPFLKRGDLPGRGGEHQKDARKPAGENPVKLGREACLHGAVASFPNILSAGMAGNEFGKSEFNLVRKWPGVLLVFIVMRHSFKSRT